MKSLYMRPWEVLAWQAGRLKQIRRAIPQKVVDAYNEYDEWCDAVMPHDVPCTRAYEKEFYTHKMPLSPGDSFEGRETWMPETEDGSPTGAYIYKANDKPYPDSDRPLRWHSPITMPPAAVRIHGVCRATRVERVNQATAADLLAMGFEHDQVYEQGCQFHGCMRLDVYQSRWQADNPACPWETAWAWVFEVGRSGE